MKPTAIKKSILFLNKKSISNLSEIDMQQINGGLATSPTTKQTVLLCETLKDCPCTHFCEPLTQTL
jgi:hypothetical protein